MAYTHTPEDDEFVKEVAHLKWKCEQKLKKATSLSLNPELFSPGEPYGSYPERHMGGKLIKSSVDDWKMWEPSGPSDFVTTDPQGKPKVVCAPYNVRLSDNGVYLALVYLPKGERGKRFAWDFDIKGSIRHDRPPVGEAPLIWAHNLPYFAVVGRSYILCGGKDRDKIGFHLRKEG